MPYAPCVFKRLIMDYLYFPGCTLYTKAKNFDQTAGIVPFFLDLN